MIVPSYDLEEMIRVHDFGQPSQTFTGGPGGLDDAPKVALINPRRVGFVRDDFYIPVYFDTSEDKASE
jgi:hypothetical protein